MNFPTREGGALPLPDIQRMPVVRAERPKRKGNRKLLTFLFVFFLTLMGVLFFQSSFSKIHRIDVEGNRLLTREQIMAAADIGVGDHFFAVSGGEIERRIGSLGAVETVQTTKRFPGQVTIRVKEFPVVALELSSEGDIAGLLSNGTSVPYGHVENAASRPILTAWEDAAMKRKLTETLATIPPEQLQDVSEIRPSPTNAYADRIVLYTRSHFEVVTTISYLAEKISLLDDYVYDMKSDNMTEGRIVLLETNYAESLDQPLTDETDGAEAGAADSEPGDAETNDAGANGGSSDPEANEEETGNDSND